MFLCALIPSANLISKSCILLHHLPKKLRNRL
jgi:hypothetical protein